MSVKLPALSGIFDVSADPATTDHTGRRIADPALPVGVPDTVAAAAPPDTIAGEPSASALSWLGDAIITGFMHCACSYQAVHPDFIDLVNGETPLTLLRCPGSGDDDAV